MQALQFTATGSLDSLKVKALPRPELATGEVLVEVRATGVNPSDIKNVQGLFPYTTLPRIPGRDFAGVVVDGPEELLGQAVWGGTGKGFGFYRDGCHAQYVAVPANAITPLPKSLTFAQAATCGVPFITAWDALERSQVKAGTRFLILGAGAVAKAAQVLALARGAEVVMAARREDVVQTLQAQDIAAFQLNAEKQLPEQASQHFQQQAPEVIFDTTGFWLAAAVNTVHTFGRVAIIAAPKEGVVDFSSLHLYRQGASIVGVNSLLYTLEECAQMLKHIGEAFDGGLPAPSDYIELPLAQAVKAYEQVSAGAADKIVLIP